MWWGQKGINIRASMYSGIQNQQIPTIRYVHWPHALLSKTWAKYHRPTNIFAALCRPFVPFCSLSQGKVHGGYHKMAILVVHKSLRHPVLKEICRTHRYASVNLSGQNWSPCWGAAKRISWILLVSSVLQKQYRYHTKIDQHIHLWHHSWWLTGRWFSQNDYNQLPLLRGILHARYSTARSQRPPETWLWQEYYVWTPR